ncbi:MAG: hypothetical protein ABI357_07490 [Granulicella sp.]
MWIVESVENKSSAVKIWAQKTTDPQLTLTTFSVKDVSQRKENCLKTIDSIELHHSEMTELLVIGLDNTESLRQGFLDLGYSLESNKDGLLARRISN